MSKNLQRQLAQQQRSKRQKVKKQRAQMSESQKLKAVKMQSNPRIPALTTQTSLRPQMTPEQLEAWLLAWEKKQQLDLIPPLVSEKPTGSFGSAGAGPQSWFGQIEARGRLFLSGISRAAGKILPKMGRKRSITTRSRNYGSAWGD